MAQPQEHKYVEIAMDDSALWGADAGADGRHPQPEERSALKDCIEAPAFQTAVGMIIIANAVVIGLETDHPDYWMWPVLEDIFLATFFAELSVRMWAWGVAGFFRPSGPDYTWNVFDFAVVTLGVADRAFALVVSGGGHDVAQRLEAGNTRFFTMLMRSFRLLRILRIFRIFRVLKQLYLLAMGFFDAVSSVLWVSALCSLVLYICAIMLTRLVGRPEASDPLAPFRRQYFGSVGESMLTLFQLMALPDMERFRALYRESPALQCFLVLFLVFGAFTCASVLTGVITESMLEKGRTRQEERRAERERARTSFIRSARRVLQDQDDDGHGFLGREQFDRCKEEVMGLCDQQCMDLRAKDLDAMFDLVDYEGSGTIEIEELLYGMVQLSADVRPMSLMELRRIVVRGLHGVGQRVSGLEERMQHLDGRVGEVLAALRAAPPGGAAPPAGGAPAPTAAPAPLPAPPAPGTALVAATAAVG